MQFPQFRRYLNGRSYFRIDGPERILEIQIVGNYYIQHELIAKILPERVFIADLIEANPEIFEVISKEDFDAFVEHNSQNRVERFMGV